MKFYVGTSNQDKLVEYKKALGPKNYLTSLVNSLDKEPLADLSTIACFKASQFKQDNVLVDDVALSVEGVDFLSIEIKFKLSELDACIGAAAVFECAMAYKRKGQVFVYVSRIQGEIVFPRGQGFGFNNYFKPNGASFTLGQKLIDVYNPRFLNIQKILRKDEPDEKRGLLEKWDGAWQAG